MEFHLAKLNQILYLKILMVLVMEENHRSSVFHATLLQKRRIAWKEIMNIHPKDFFMI